MLANITFWHNGKETTPPWKKTGSLNLSNAIWFSVYGENFEFKNKTNPKHVGKRAEVLSIKENVDLIRKNRWKVEQNQAEARGRERREKLLTKKRKELYDRCKEQKEESSTALLGEQHNEFNQQPPQQSIGTGIEMMDTSE
jgi:hypothetical protein